MGACSCCGCAGCAGCAVGASFCGCGVSAACVSPILYRGIFGGRGSSQDFDQQMDEYKQKMDNFDQEVDKFNSQNVTYKEWSITLTVDKNDKELLYIAGKEGEEKRFSDTNLKNLEQRIDKFESEGKFHRELDRLL